MANLFIEFQGMLKGNKPSADMLVPILIWASGSEKNIEACQRVNKKFLRVNRNILIVEVSLHNKLKHIIKYPKVSKDDEKTKFFYNDLANYFGWSHRELKKNLNIVDIDNYKPLIAKAFGYDNAQRKAIGLEVIQYAKKKENGTGKLRKPNS